MSPASLTPAIAEKLDSIEASGEDNYREIVLKIATGEDVEAAELREALHGSNRTRSELEKHVTRAQSRIAAVENLTKSKEIQLTLPTLEEASTKATEELKALRKKHEAELSPLLAKQDETYNALQSAKQEAHQLHVDAMATLGQTASADFTDGFGRLSTIANKLEADCREFKTKESELRAEIESVKNDRDHHQATLDRFDEERNPLAEHHRPEHERGLRRAEEKLELLHRKLQSGLDLEGKYHAARDALETHEADQFYDWRNFDS